MGLLDAADWSDFNWKEFYDGTRYSSEISYDSGGERTLEQVVEGTGEEEYIYMTRSVEDLYHIEKDEVNKMFIDAEEYPQKVTSDFL